MLRKVFISVLGAVAMGGFIAACDQSDKKASAPQASPETSLAAKEGHETEKNQTPGLPAAVGETKAPESQTEPRPGRGTPLTSEQRKRFAQSLKVEKPIQTLQVSQVVTIPVEMKNLGPEPWLTEVSPSGERPVKLWYHWIDWKPEIPASEEQASSVAGEKKKKPKGLGVPRSTARLRKEGKVVKFGGARTPLPRVVNPNETVNVEATVEAPSRPGEFILRLTMMREGEGSFENRGGIPLDLPVVVTQQ